MANYSFDITSQVDNQEVENSINNAMREIITRYDFKGTNCKIELKEKEILFDASDEFKAKALQDILMSKAVKRNIDARFFEFKDIEQAGGGRVRQTVVIHEGIEREKAKEIVQTIKEAKLKVQAQIMDNQIRVSGKSKDDLQNAMVLVKKTDFKLPLQFGNYR